VTTCETCVHFRRYVPDEDGRIWGGPEGLAQAEAPRWGTCTFVIDTNDARHEPHSERAYPQDASGYQAWLMVREDFGCIEHTSKETT
jgi:hypothetical protein